MSKTIELQWTDDSGKPKEAARFNMFLQGFDVGQKIVVDIWEVDQHADYAAHGERKLGSIAGVVDQPEGSVRQYLQSTSADPAGAPAQDGNDPYVTIVVEQPGAGKPWSFPLNPPGDKVGYDFWEIRARAAKEPAARSGIYYVSLQDKRIPEVQATYRWHGGNQVKFYNNASADSTGAQGYFRDLTDAIAHAQHFIFIADWSFQPYLRLLPSDDQRLGQQLANFCAGGTERVVAIHTWDHTAPLGLGAYDPHNDDGERMLKEMCEKFMKDKKKPANLLWRASSRAGGFLSISAQSLSHHQKFVVLDCECPWDTNTPKRRMLRLFIGGIDLTQGRFDWPEHPILPADNESGCAPLLKVKDHVKLTYKQRLGLEPDFPIHNWYTGEFGDKTPIDFGAKSETRKFLDGALGALKNANINVPGSDMAENLLAPQTPLAVKVDDPDFHPREAWHDIHSSIIGAAAWDVVREFIGRWNLDAAGPLFRAEGDRSDAGKKKLVDELLKAQLFDRTRFVQQWEGVAGPVNEHSGPWNAQLLRSLVKDHWGADKPVVTPAAHKKRKDGTEFAWAIDNGKFERSIQDSYLRAIAQAEKFIYVETQFFIGKPRADNTLPEALAQRIIARKTDGKPFHVYLVLPMFPEGDPASIPYQLQRSFQWRSIDHMVRMVQKGVGDDWRKYLTIGFPANWSDPDDPGAVDTDTRIAKCRKNHRYMIYVHSKMMIVDDRYMIIGSANLNERSLSGERDSEICMALWPGPGAMETCEEALRSFRKELWAEHFGSAPPKPDQPEDPENGAAIQKQAEINSLLMRRHAVSGGRVGNFCSWFIDGTKDGLGLFGVSHVHGKDSQGNDLPAGDNNLGFIVDGVIPDKLSKQAKDFLDSNPLTKGEAKKAEDAVSKEINPVQNAINAVPGLANEVQKAEDKVQAFVEGAPGAEYLVWPAKFLELEAFELVGGKSLE